MRDATIRELHPPPWRAEPIAAGWRVVASNNTAVAYVYAAGDGAAVGTSSSETNPYVRSRAEARAIAHAIAALPTLLASHSSRSGA